MRVGLVGCVKTKLPYGATAADLYVSPLYVGRRRYVERTCDRWFILSAKHGVVDPHETLDPYDESLNQISAAERRTWSERVLQQLEDALGDLRRITFAIHAGAAYRDFGLISGLAARGGIIEVPAQHLSQGQQLAFYARTPPNSHSTSAPTVPKSAASYSSLARYLSGLVTQAAVISVDELEQMLGKRLPESARRHRAWWANDETHSQARAWLGAGWRVAGVHLGESVSFKKVSQ